MGRHKQPLPPAKLAWAIEEARRAREQQPCPYAAARARRHPWLTLAEAAFELDLTQQRITQLVTAGTIRAKRDPARGRLYVRVSAEDVYKYQPQRKRKAK